MIILTTVADNLFYIQMTGGHDCKQDVECYIIKNDVCVAIARIDVPIK